MSSILSCWRRRSPFMAAHSSGSTAAIGAGESRGSGGGHRRSLGLRRSVGRRPVGVAEWALGSCPVLGGGRLMARDAPSRRGQNAAPDQARSACSIPASARTAARRSAAIAPARRIRRGPLAQSTTVDATPPRRARHREMIKVRAVAGWLTTSAAESPAARPTDWPMTRQGPDRRRQRSRGVVGGQQESDRRGSTGELGREAGLARCGTTRVKPPGQNAAARTWRPGS